MALAENENRHRVLVLGQDLAAMAKRCAQLTLAGWDTLQVLDPIEAFTAVKSQEIDAVLLHLDITDVVAMDLPTVLRKVADASYLPVTILADNPPESQRCRFLECGVDDIFSENLSAVELVARLRVLLRFKDLHDQLANSQAALRQALDRERKLLSELRQDNENLHALASTDPLTSVHNVRSFHSILSHEFKMAKRYNHPLSLLMLDLDYFKMVNDSYGHPTGDFVLKELASILKSSVRESDVVCRTGGEEFCVVLPRADGPQAEQFAERIRRQVQNSVFSVYGHSVRITLSVGWTTYPREAEIASPEMMVYFADQALLMAKETGRNRVIAVRNMDASVRTRLRRQFQTIHPPMPNNAGSAPSNEFACTDPQTNTGP